MGGHLLSRLASPRPPRPTVALAVVATEWLSPHLVRVRLGGPGFAAFEDRPETDKCVKLMFTTPPDAGNPNDSDTGSSRSPQPSPATAAARSCT